jgi:hypothetical protein
MSNSYNELEWLHQIKKEYEYMDGSGCNPALFDSLTRFGAERVAQDMGQLIAKIEFLRRRVDVLSEDEVKLKTLQKLMKYVDEEAMSDAIKKYDDVLKN